MEVFDEGGHDGRGRHVDQVLHVTQRLLFVEIQSEFVLHFTHRLVRFQRYVRDTGVALKKKKIREICNKKKKKKFVKKKIRKKNLLEKKICNKFFFIRNRKNKFQ